MCGQQKVFLKSKLMSSGWCLGDSVRVDSVSKGEKLCPAAAAAEGKPYFPDLPSFHTDTAVLAVKSMS